MPDSGCPDDLPADTAAASRSPVVVPAGHLPLLCGHECEIHLPGSEWMNNENEEYTYVVMCSV